MTPPWPTRSPGYKTATLALLAVAYFGTALLGFRLAMPGTNATAVWIPTGLAMAVVLRLGFGIWPGIFLGALAANLFQLSSLGLPPLTLAWASLTTAAGNTAEALLAGYLVERATGTRNPFETGGDTIQFILLGALLSTAVSAGVGTAAYCGATGRWDLFLNMGTTWWMGDAVGALVLVPLLTFSREELAQLPSQAHREVLASAALLLILSFGVFHSLHSLAFLILPLLVLAAVRLGPFYASALVGFLCAVVALSTLMGQGGFIRGVAPQEALLIQQGFLGSLAITTTVLAVSLRARKVMEAQLLQRNRLYRTLSEVNQAIVHAEDRTALLQAACRILVEHGGFRMAWTGFKDEASGRLRPEASAGLTGSYLQDYVIRWDDSPEGMGPSGEAIRGNHEVIVGDFPNDPRLAPWQKAARTLGFRTSCAFPIRQEGAVTGALMAYHGEPNAIGPEEGRLLDELAKDLGYALGVLETRLDLLESERRVRSILENVELLAVTLGTDGTITFCNDFMLHLLGWPREEVLGRSCFERFLPADAHPAVRSLLAACLDAGEVPLHQENEILTRAGQRRLVRWNNMVLRDRTGQVVGTVSLGEDVTERKQAEEEMRSVNAELQRSQATLLALQERLLKAQRVGHMGFLDWDLATDAIVLSDEMLRIYGLEGGSNLTTPALVGGYTHPDDLDMVREGLTMALGEDQPYDLDHRIVRPDGVVRWVHAQAELQKNALGGPRNLLGTAIDITERKVVEAALAELHGRLREHAATLEQRVEERTALLQKANEDLAQAVDHAQAADLAKSAFLATMSHELRTPLNSIIGFTGILLQGLVGPLNEEQKKQLGMVRESSRHLLDLINDVLDISKIEAGQLEVSLQPFDLRACLEKCVHGVRPLAEKRGISLGLNLGAGIGTLCSDRRRVEQVFLNLLSNAIKFTEQGGVTVTCAATDFGVEVKVRDTGIGIGPGDLDKLFRPFQQVDTGLTRKYEGTGLGLSISKHLVELLGGRIQVESAAGQGSAFAFSLPLGEGSP